MIPPINLFCDLINAFQLFIQDLEDLDDDLSPNNMVHMSFMYFMDFLIIYSNISLMFIEHFLDNNHDWEAHKL